MTITLYPKQLEIADKSIDLLQRHDAQFDLLVKNRIYLSGEMGVGKTVIGSYITAKMVNEHPSILIVAPDSVGMVQKWVDHLIQFNEITLTDINKIEKRNDVWVEGKINVIKSKLLASRVLQSIDEDELNSSPNIDLLIIDEFHALSKTAVRRLRSIYSTTPNKIKSSYYMTGTIFNEQFNDTLDLIDTTHPYFMDHFARRRIDAAHSQAHKLPVFIDSIWRYISLSISLDDINVERVDDGPSQTIMPIEPIAIPEEERLYFNFIKLRTSNLAADASSKKTKLKIAEYLDLPSGSLIEDRMTKVQRNASNINSRHMRQRESYILGESLTELSFEKSLKFIQLKKILKNNTKDRFMIYATNKQVAHLIYMNLMKLSSDKHKLDVKNYFGNTDFIDGLNDQLENTQEDVQAIAIVNPKDVTTGVDISADAIVWYQVLPSVQEILQAQRRVHRLSSDTDSRVYFLVYEMTFQEELINDVSNSAKNNASAYGTKDESALAQITGVLLNGVN